MNKENEIESKRYKSISNSWDRLRHLVIDLIVLLILTSLIHFNISSALFDVSKEQTGNVFFCTFLCIYFLYYLFFETTFGQTPGKFLNKTEVVTNEMKRPDWKSVFIRAIVRLVPLQHISIYTIYNRPLHDMISRTWVLRK